MKTMRVLFILTGLFFFRATNCDIIPDNSHYVSKCVKITNLDDYTEISLLGFGYNIFGEYGFYSYLIVDSVCLFVYSKWDVFSVFAVLKTYLIGQDVEHMGLPNDPNAIVSDVSIYPNGYYIHDSIPINSVDQFYKIMGFTDSSVVLFKWKEITRFNNDTPDKTETYEYNGDSTLLSQQFPDIDDLSNHTKYGMESKLYPNPSSNNIILNMVNCFYGKVNVDVYSPGGQLLKSYLFNKSDMRYSVTMTINDLAKGTYIVNLRYGGIVESQKIVIH